MIQKQFFCFLLGAFAVLTQALIVELCAERHRASVMSALSGREKVLHVRHLRAFPAIILSEEVGLPEHFDLVEGVCKIHKKRRNYISGLPGMPRDALIKEIAPDGVWWHLDRVNQDFEPLDGDARFAGDGRGTNIFILDTGLDTLHDEFAPDANRPARTVRNVASYVPGESFEYWPEVGWVDRPHDMNLIQVNDKHGHGTMCSGTAAGASLGLAPGANIYHIKVLSNDGSGGNEWSLYAMERVAQLVAEKKVIGPTVVSCSFGDKCEYGDPHYCESDDVQSRAVSSLVEDLGVAVVVASGNQADDGCFYEPQAATRAISVGASDQFDRIANWSNYGACVNIIAPGVDLPLAKSRLAFNETPVEKVPAAEPPYTTEYVTVASGTSFSAPLVAGSIALYAQLLGFVDTVTASRVVLQKAVSGVLSNTAQCPSNQRLLRIPNAFESLDDLMNQNQAYYSCPDPPFRANWPLDSTQKNSSSNIVMQPWGAPPPFSSSGHDHNSSRGRHNEHIFLSTYGHPLRTYLEDQEELLVYHRREVEAVVFLGMTICAGLILAIYRNR
mmetsp:Transcript_17778/g.23174  ORF Transcript_17778/g.23174 Transcript_17778/m.23174 type:complete len:557 (-) Transcript_17778:83-1753(-)